MKKALLVIGTVLLIAIILYQGSSKSDQAESFRTTLDSLHKQNDSLQASIANKSTVIDSLEVLDSALIDKLANQKPKVITITKFVDSSKSAIDTYTEQELISSFNKRYPEDTTSNLLALAQPVLKSAAKDLVELDGEKELSSLKDSVITIQEDRINNKDAVIREYVSKEKDYEGIIVNKNVEIKTWVDQYDRLKEENRKLRKRSKIHKVISSILAGTLTLSFIIK
jgi:hypothetical protein